MTDRQRIIENNRSLRNIKNELESLLERGVIDEDVFDSISAQLPAESPLSSTPNPPSNPHPLPPRNPASVATATSAMAGLYVAPPATAHAAMPPAYSQTPPPALPVRNTPMAPPPEKPVLTHARALYRYEAADARDVALERDDHVAVHDYVNDQWWMGRNLRTGEEGIFPKTYVLVEQEKTPVQRPPPPPVPGSSMAPVSMATLGNVGGPAAQQGAHEDQEEPGKPSKMEQHGKKFGKKLGNAAIFGAGATIGSNLVNSIF